jgi:multicomponent Na+:H+ antiporter subunit E
MAGRLGAQEGEEQGTMPSKPRSKGMPARRIATRLIGLWCWGYLVWALLTWTLTVEQVLFGAFIAAAVAVGLAPLGEVAGPWKLLRPRALAGGAWLLLAAAGRVFLANLRLARRIWDPHRPLASGMVITPTRERTDWGLAAVGVISSLIVDNQITDLDARAHELQYHAVAVPDGGRDTAYQQINGPVEDLLKPFQPRKRTAR